MAGSAQGPGARSSSSHYQETLINFCRSNNIRAPVWQDVSDRRGGRTAWSSIVQVTGLQPVQARFWYDGQYVNSAKEDAAQLALQRLGQLPTSAPPQASNQQQPHQQQQPQQSLYAQYLQQQQPTQQQHQQQCQQHSGQSRPSYSQQKRYYGPIGS